MLHEFLKRTIPLYFPVVSEEAFSFILCLQLIRYTSGFLKTTVQFPIFVLVNNYVL